VTAELEWLANLTNPKTRRAYKIDVEEFNGCAVSLLRLQPAASHPQPSWPTETFKGAR
jgi:hypothetical protein